MSLFHDSSGAHRDIDSCNTTALSLCRCSPWDCCGVGSCVVTVAWASLACTPSLSPCFSPRSSVPSFGRRDLFFLVLSSFHVVIWPTAQGSFPLPFLAPLHLSFSATPSLSSSSLLRGVCSALGLASTDPVLTSLELPTKSVIPVWADDAVVLLAQHTTPQLLQAAEHTFEAVHCEYTRRAMAPNYALANLKLFFPLRG